MGCKALKPRVKACRETMGNQTQQWNEWLVKGIINENRDTLQDWFDLEDGTIVYSLILRIPDNSWFLVI